MVVRRHSPEAQTRRAPTLHTHTPLHPPPSFKRPNLHPAERLPETLCAGRNHKRELGRAKQPSDVGHGSGLGPQNGIALPRLHIQRESACADARPAAQDVQGVRVALAVAQPRGVRHLRGRRGGDDGDGAAHARRGGRERGGVSVADVGAAQRE